MSRFTLVKQYFRRLIMSVVTLPKTSTNELKKVVWSKVQKEDWADVMFIDELGNSKTHLCKVVFQGTKRFLKYRKQTYAYEPISNHFGIVENGNAIPYCIGGWIPKKTLENVKAKLKREGDITKDAKNKEVLRFIVTNRPYLLKDAVIRPFKRYSAVELYEAIHSKVTTDLMKIPYDTLALITLVCILGCALITYWYGTNLTNALNDIMTKLSTT